MFSTIGKKYILKLVVFTSHQVRSLIHHIEYNSALHIIPIFLPSL